MTLELQGDAVISTAAVLAARIEERFPESSLGEVARDVLRTARATRETSAAIRRPNVPLRIFVGVLVAGIVALSIGVVTVVPLGEGVDQLPLLIQVLEAGINDLVLIGAAIFFLVTVEVRIKRRRALRALHDLRSLAHVIDMHQLTKDPERLLFPGEDTPSSPVRTMTPFLLSRYLDYCSELLSIIGKVAALHAQSFDDPVALGAVDEVETLTTGLSRKIWQKIMILNAVGVGRPAPVAPPADD